MTNLSLSKRLKTLAELAKNNDLVLDVGCDHAKLAIYLVENNYVNRVIASDLREKPLARAIEEVSARGLEKRIKCVLASGIEHVNENVDLAIIAGMGGHLISDIITSPKIEYIDKLLVQANSDHQIVRKTMISLGFKITNEVVIEEDNIYYTFIYAERGSSDLDDLELNYGPLKIKSKSQDFINFVNKQNKYYLDLLTKIPKESQKYAEILMELEKTEEVITRIKQIR